MMATHEAREDNHTVSLEDTDNVLERRGARNSLDGWGGSGNHCVAQVSLKLVEAERTSQSSLTDSVTSARLSIYTIIDCLRRSSDPGLNGHASSKPSGTASTPPEDEQAAVRSTEQGDSHSFQRLASLF